MKNLNTSLLLALFIFVFTPKDNYALTPTNNATIYSLDEDRPSSECDNVTESGSIGYNQSNVGAFIPETIVSISPASGGTGPVEYVWIKKYPGPYDWVTVPGATGEEYSPGMLTETTIFRRCARNAGCDSFDGESNNITITIVEPDPLDVDEFNDCSAEGGIEYSVQIEGMEDSPDACMTVSDTTGMISMYVEVWLQNTNCPGHHLPSDIEIEVDGVPYTAEGVIAEQSSPGGSVEKIYRIHFVGVAEEVCVVDADLCDVLSTALYIKRISDEHSSSSFKTYNKELHHSHTSWGSPDCVTDVLLVGESLMARDIEVYIPVHEKDDSRTVNVTINISNDAGTIVATTSESFTEQNAGSEASLYSIIIPSVPGDGTNVEIEVCSPHGSGDSFGIGAVALTTAGGCVTCEMLELTIVSEDPTCDEIDGGSATVSIIDGTGPFSYLWSDGQTTATAAGLEAGTYTVTVTDVNDCIEESEVTIGLPPCCNVTESGEIGSNQENCGPFDPALLESFSPASGGVGPVEYLWIKSDTLTPPIEGESYWEPIPGATGLTYDPGFLTESTYFVRCSRNEGCDQYPGESNIISIIINPIPELTITATDVNCESISSGSATTVLTNGTAPYSYEWSDGQTTATATDLEAGDYTVTITDANGCEVEGEVTIGLPPCCNVTESGEIGSDQENCGPFDPALLESFSPASGGVGPVEYLWIKSDTLTPPIEGESYWEPIPGATGLTYDPGFLTESTYFVRCSRNEGCDQYPGESNIISIIVNPIPELTITTDQVACSGMASGSATATVSDGTAPYSYEWSDGQIESIATDLSAGTYTVTITDANGCTVEDEIEITEFAEALATTMSGDAIDCFGGTSSATVTTTGGTAPYSYDWSDGQTTVTATDLTVGTYTVTITDANGCTITDEIEITAPAAALATTMSGDAIDCFGGTSSATVTTTGGTAPYSYEWSDGQTEATATDLSVGTYSVTITDANGCTITDEIEITAPAAALATTMNGDAIDCFGGTSTATVTVSGGTSPYTYEWSNGQTDPTATELTAGTYTVTITDANGCTTTDEIEITAPAAALATTMSGDAIDCFGGTSTGTVTVSGGTSPYTYEWSNGQTDPTTTELTAGTYTVTITDANGCATTDEIEITAPAAALATIMSGDAIDCFGGTSSATVSTTGGTAPYSYEWSDGQTEATATDLSAGTYTVTINDANGCTITDEIEITQPAAALATTMSGDAIDCFGGTSSATVSTSGGTAPYTYEWSNGQTEATATDLEAGTYTVTITDANGCTITDEIEITQPAAALATTMSGDAIDCFGGTSSATVLATGGTSPYTYEWSDGQTEATATDLGAGTYTVTVTDANGCTTEGEIEITQPAAALATTMSGDAIDCFGGTSSATVTVTGGTAPYSYEWSDGQTEATATDLSVGTYSVAITDANGCTITDEIEITAPAAALATTMSGDAIDCFGGTSTGTVTVSGGTSPYTYEWSDGQTEATATDLEAGTYTVTITDANGCTTTDEIEITQPDAALATTMSGDAIDCFGGTSSATVTTTGGTAPYSYEWSDGQTTVTATDLTVGTYTVTITDANGCTITDEIEITAPAAALATTMSGDAIDCFGGTSSATVTVTGGTAPYSYEWSDGQTEATATDLSAGIYTVTITDANGCTTTDEIEITEPAAALATTMSGDAIDCFGGTSTATVTVSGGTSPYTYEWSNGQTTATATELAAGTYTVTITDANGCTTTDEIEITGPAAALATTMSGDAIDCFGGTSSATVTVSGGTAPYSYEWSDGQTEATGTDLSVGTYSVTITDANGCTITDEIEITGPDAALSAVFEVSNVSCFGGYDGSASVIVSGGTSPYDYFWFYMEIDVPTITEAPAGTYTVIITDANGCTITETIEITQPDAALATAISGDAIECFGGTSSATVTVTDGTAPYTYEWSDGQTEASATDLEAGIYSVTVTDANGCTITDEIEITEPAAALATTMSGDAIDCFGGTSSATVLATGGTSPYTYEWSDGQTEATATDLGAGIYTVTVTDANGCTTEGEIEITQPDAPLSATFDVINVTCFGGSDGSATVNVSGGTAPYEYFWYYMEIGDPTITDAPAGTYPVVITDANGCEIIAEITIEQPEEIEATFEVSDVSCFGGYDGSATVTISGGTAPYEYFWYYMEIDVPTITESPAGEYTVVITDANGCESLATVTISGPSEPISSTYSTTLTSCFDGGDGTATITATGGTGPYTYEWSDGQTGPTALDLEAGTIICFITDANGCLHEETIEISEPDALSFEFTMVDVSCFGGDDGEATVSVTGGTEPYSYDWSNGQTEATATGLSATMYVVIITDANGCSGGGEVTIGEPEELALELTATEVSCFDGADGTATVSVTGGTAPYEYLWSFMEMEVPTITDAPAGTYMVTITDANGCSAEGEITIGQPDEALEATFSTEPLTCFGETDAIATVSATGGTPGYTYEWSDGQTEATAIDLGAGTYSVTITDANGCSITIETIEIIEAEEMEVTFLVSDIFCYGSSTGQIEAIVSGGTPDYTYEWSDGQTEATAIDLEAGTYSVTVLDANGCTTTSDDVILEEGPMLTLDISTFIGEICDGMVWVTPSGGTAPYTYEWEHGADEADLTGLCEGAYFVTVTDANGCSASSEVIIAYTIMGIGITVAPNPIIDHSMVTIKTAAETEIFVDVLNARGQEVIEYLYTGKTDEYGNVIIDFSTTDLESGMYIIRVRSINGSEVERVIVQ